MASIWEMGPSVCALMVLAGCAGMTARPIPGGAGPPPDVAAIRAMAQQVCIAPPQPAANDETARMARNNLVTAYLAAADGAYAEYERRLLHASRSRNVGAAIADVAGDEALARGLTTASGIVAGTQRTVDRDYWLNQILSLLQTQMRTNRARQGAVILARLGLPHADWTACAALPDLVAYEQAGTLNAALAGLAALARDANAEGEARRRASLDRPERP